MASTVLRAEWRNLLMANYAIEPAVLHKYLPCRTELDNFNGIHYVSPVGFLFKNVKLKGFKITYHHTFKEVNLRSNRISLESRQRMELPESGSRKGSKAIVANSVEEFITEHYWAIRLLTIHAPVFTK